MNFNVENAFKDVFRQMAAILEQTQYDDKQALKLSFIN